MRTPGLTTTTVALAAGLTFVVGPAARARDKEKEEPRHSLIARATVRMPADIPSMDLKAGPTGPDAFAPGETLACDFVDRRITGASPKFWCRPADGKELKVKYGGDNGEVYGEVVATRLLWALGFGADRMYSVRVVCHGCPEALGGIERENGDRILDPAAVERKYAGKELSDYWDWSELDKVDERKGGAPAAERDALKLLAVFMQHSDSKPTQQRLVCADHTGSKGRGDSKGRSGSNEHCDVPLMMINDLGMTFGRANTFNDQPGASVDLARWKEVSIWKEKDGCVGNLSGSSTGTLKYPVISDGGRQLLASLLTQLSDQQLHDMFEAARVQLRPRDPENGSAGFPSIDEWVNVFKDKRTQIVVRRCAGSN